MVYLQSYLIILLEVACLYLFQDTFTRSKVSKRKIVVPIWMLLVSISCIVNWNIVIERIVNLERNVCHYSIYSFFIYHKSE